MLSSSREKEGDSAKAKLKGAVDFVCVKENDVFPLKGCYEREREILIFERIFAFPPKEGQREKNQRERSLQRPFKEGWNGSKRETGERVPRGEISRRGEREELWPSRLV